MRPPEVETRPIVAKQLARQRGASRTCRPDTGTTVVEYALLLALVAVAAAGGLTFAGRAMTSTLTSVAARIADGTGLTFLVDGQPCPGDPCALTVGGTGGQQGSPGDTERISVAGESAVTYNAPGPSGTPGIFYFSPLPGGVLQMTVTGVPTPPLLIDVSAVDATGATGSLDLSLTVLSRYDATVAVPGGTCNVPLTRCNDAAWLDGHGYYMYLGGTWLEIVSSAPPPGPGSIGDAQALTDATGTAGTGLHASWTCAKTSADGKFCLAISTGTPSVHNYALATIATSQ